MAGEPKLKVRSMDEEIAYLVREWGNSPADGGAGVLIGRLQAAFAIRLREARAVGETETADRDAHREGQNEGLRIAAAYMRDVLAERIEMLQLGKVTDEDREWVERNLAIERTASSVGEATATTPVTPTASSVDPFPFVTEPESMATNAHDVHEPVQPDSATAPRVALNDAWEWVDQWTAKEWERAGLNSIAERVKPLMQRLRNLRESCDVRGRALEEAEQRAEAAEAALKALRDDCARWAVNIEWAVDHISGRVASVGDQRDGADTIVRQCLAELRARSTATASTTTETGETT